jgi:hypothetical protein
MTMKLPMKTIRSLAPALALSLLPCFLHANGYNNINRIAVPALTGLIALLYGVIAPVPALMVLPISRLAGRGNGPGFAPLYLGSFAGGEAGIGICLYLRSILNIPGTWNSYHYTLYPWVVLGMSLAGAFLALIIGRRTRTP